ncbi:MAG: MurR/RpiR family transcriptional regulator [Alphaproteobacteria bacterium]|nr:MurR/RpiR family transcriptional regulator [Alphaproteobacteria bacterium]
MLSAKGKLVSTKTIADRLREKGIRLTRAERQLADAILKNYPASGLGTITTVASAANVSTPTVARLVQKLGFAGFPDFQAHLRQELNEKISGPIAKRERWANSAPDGHILNRFTEAVIDNISQSLGSIDIAQFDEACGLLSDQKRSIFVVGGRITRTLADYFFLHMQVIRRDVTHISSSSNAWPHYLLDIDEGDIVVIFDIRRYENATLRLAEMAKQRGAIVVLFTDQWQSPISSHADFCFNSQIVVPSAWDSTIACMLLLEIIIAEVQEQHWETTKARMEELESMFDRTRFFRKFS